MKSSVAAIVVLAAFALPAPKAFAYSGGVTGRTNKTGGAGCASCHGASADSAMTVAISGPSGSFC